MDQCDFVNSLPDGWVSGTEEIDDGTEVKASSSRTAGSILPKTSITSKDVKIRCWHCGEFGHEESSCHRPSFRRKALRRVEEEELIPTCSRCGELGHHCLNCHILITYNWERCQEFPSYIPRKPRNQFAAADAAKRDIIVGLVKHPFESCRRFDVMSM